MKRIFTLFLTVALAIVLPICAAEEAPLEGRLTAFLDELSTAQAPGLNAYEADWEAMVAHLTEQGALPADAEPVDMLTTPGYLLMYDGTMEDAYPFADRAEDFGGVYLMWWDLVEPSEAFDCYTAMLNNAGNIVVMGGMYVLDAIATPSGSYALAFSADCDEATQEAALAAFTAVDAAVYSLKYMTSATDLAMAMLRAGLLAPADLAGFQDMNAHYAYPAMREDWVGYDVSETGYGEAYETTDFAELASQAYDFGAISILYYAPADVSETSWYPHMIEIFDNLETRRVLTPYCRPGTDWDYVPYTVDADGAYSPEGDALELPVDLLYGQFAVIING